jgi:drug/metabolite transporter (DMT)-like permease
MPLALVGLALALDVVGTAGRIAGRWIEIGVGVGWALAASILFTAVLVFTTRYLQEVDGRVRSLLTMGATAVVVCAAGAATQSLALPADGAGWLGLALLTLLYGSAITAVFIVVPRLSTASTTVALNVEPIAAMLMAWVALGQAMNATQVLGVFVVVGAVIYLATGKH